MQPAFAMVQAVMPALAARISFQKRQQRNIPLTQPYIRRISNQLDGRKQKLAVVYVLPLHLSLYVAMNPTCKRDEGQGHRPQHWRHHY